jgi:hypothetical protein
VSVVESSTACAVQCALPAARASAHVRFIACRLAKLTLSCLTMSSLHSCRWDWCRFTTVLHDDFVQHVVSTHINNAEPVKRADISLIRKVEQGASAHSGESTFQRSCDRYFIVIDSFMGGISNVTAETTGARSEAPQPSFTSGSTSILPISQQMQHPTSPDGSLAGVGHHSLFIQLCLTLWHFQGQSQGTSQRKSQAPYKSQSLH